MAQSLTQTQCLAGVFLSPCGGEEQQAPKKKKNACALPDLFGPPFLDAPMCASKTLTVFLHSRYLLRRVLLPLWYPHKKKE